jgi:LruC domain-containing protein
MKKLIFSLITSLGLFSIASAQTPLPILNAESGNRSLEQANCWAFGSVSYSNLEFRIAGFWSMRTNQLTNAATTACWIKTPWFKPGSGNITLKARLENASGTSRGIVVQYCSYDPNAINSTKESAYTSFYTYAFPTPLNINVQSLTIPVPSAIANASTPYKVIISFVGQNGNSRAFVDDVNIPGTYFADPSNNCLPQTQIADKDADGVADNDDAYPEDKDRAYDVQLPDATESTLMFEDLWPATGDYDFNDFVASYKAIAVTNADNKVVEVKITTKVMAIGASYNNSFAVQFDDLKPEAILAVKGNLTNNSKIFSFNENGTEAGQDNANIIIFDQARTLFPGVGGSGINVNPEGPFVNAENVTVTISFNTGKETAIEVKELELNPYIIVNQNREIEVHLPDYEPSDLANKKLFGTEKDNSSFEKGIYYKSANNLPFAIKVEGLVPHMIEKQDILTGYPKLADWAISEGKEYQNWYNASEGFRENKLLIYLEGVK